ncbi:MAG: hypothetical protein P4N59_05855 [Negativicutes bacterium]|nr:hypothetical protein [Negativicutes bacterium]
MEKKEYMDKMEERLAQYNVKLAQMRAKALQVQTDMRREYIGQVKMLESKRDSLRETFGQLKEASTSAWEDAKDGTEKAFLDLKDTFDKIKNRFMF